MELQDIAKYLKKLERKKFLQTSKAEQTCVSVTFELYSDLSCAVKYHWHAKSFKKSETEEERMLNNITAMLKSEQETVQVFDSLENFQRFLIDNSIF